MLFARIADRLIAHGRLTIVDAHGHRHVVGDGAGPEVTIRLHDRRLHLLLALHPHLHFGEAYMDGRLTIENGCLEDLIEILVAAMPGFRDSLSGRTGFRLGRILRWLHHFNPIGRARANVAHHYDLSDDLYDLFLDRERQYSCAYFVSDHGDLERAQQDKMRHITRKLLLAPGQRVLDIGCGWGSLALHLARTADCEVTGITLSERQLAVARERARKAGLADRVHFELRDYRELAGSFDRIVSVGMFEHVGTVNYGTFFARLGALLAPDGVALLHSIGRMSGPDATNAWIRKYIFPGGYIPALSEVVPEIERRHMWLTDVEILRLHYAHTLDAWHERFVANRTKIAKLYDECFCRMWEFYLLGSKTMFRTGDLMVFQMQIAHRRDAVPLTRDYLHVSAANDRPALRGRHVAPGLTAAE